MKFLLFIRGACICAEENFISKCSCNTGVDNLWPICNVRVVARGSGRAQRATSSRLPWRGAPSQSIARIACRVIYSADQQLYHYNIPVPSRSIGLIESRSTLWPGFANFSLSLNRKTRELDCSFVIIDILDCKIRVVGCTHWDRNFRVFQNRNWKVPLTSCKIAIKLMFIILLAYFTYVHVDI